MSGRWTEEDLHAYLARQGVPQAQQPTRHASAGTAEERESVFLGRILALAKRQGWLAYHTHDSRKSEAGFPDLVLVRPGECLMAELKRSAREKPTMAQQTWLSLLASAGLETSVWRPGDWGAIVERLTRPQGRR